MKYLFICGTFLLPRWRLALKDQLLQFRSVLVCNWNYFTDSSVYLEDKVWQVVRFWYSLIGLVMADQRNQSIQDRA